MKIKNTDDCYGNIQYHDYYIKSQTVTTLVVLYPLKKSENLWFFQVFRGDRKGSLA